ncbi:MnhB domain-containing protein [Gracilimonas mengyeensis]|uniref:Multisubunit sodium/proton antiporter, MrpB subunit n=1 Tax=Gracilimonas mengyeensis TaxID=1302730 RepID=A0A521ASI4_9BACT|nr:MnhB domain-containing protein [Gracilimonas mengyeensis]SMO37784.1 multisubunit sodium/proton antiporter, MrpB subunit [Gracilimonas mengyeensis]
MTNKSSSPIVLYGTRFLSPYIMLFGFYVIFHGHYSPGGGFQGGTLLAVSLLLIRIASGTDLAQLQFKEYLTTPLAALGVVIYFGTGLTALIMGGYFLDYEELPIPGLEPAYLRYWGILIIELGIGLTVMTVLTLIYDNMVKGEDYA